MKPLKVIKKLFKFGSKAASKSKGSGGGGAFEWPAGIKIGIYGHQNSGKTVYFTVLNEESKISKNLQLSVTDNATSNSFLMNRRAIWGLGSTSEVGTVVDLRGERKFPDPSEKDQCLIFNAILDGSTKVPVVAYDFPGKSIALAGGDELKDKIIDFMTSCDGLLFFYDPKVMGSELESQAHVSSFVSLIEQIAPGHKRLPIPVGLVVTKADVLPGFAKDDQVMLISPEDEHLLSDDFDMFLNRMLAGKTVSADQAWAGSVRNVLIKLADFLKVIVGRTLNFQIFFVSNTGDEPEKVGTDVGRSIYKPPSKIRPIGVKDPFYWILTAVRRNRGVSRIRALAKVVMIVSIIWAVLCSMPFIYHLNYLLPQAELVEREILKANSGQVFSTGADERRRIQTAYSRYENSWCVKWFFKEFQAPSGKVRQFYRDFDISESVKVLDKTITRFNAMVSDSAYWPKLNPATDSLEMLPDLEKMLADLGEFHTGDETSVLFTRSGRVLRYWELFSQFIASRGDSTIPTAVVEQVKFNGDNYGTDLSDAERKLGKSLVAKLQVKTEAKAKVEASKRAVVELDDLIEEVNGNNDPSYRLDGAVKRLRKIKSDLTDRAAIKAVDRYIRDAKKWAKKQKFTYRIETVPDNAHLHIEVTARGENPTWAEQNQIFEGDEYPFEWKLNDDIHISFDAIDRACNWGANPSDKIVLKGKYCLFEMEGNLTFQNVGKQVTISFKPELAGRLPVLKK
ncbi:MAG: hypothetical protein KAT79_05005 [candidate division Zixibacteria bacterium]|nr:hypothetical protein [candidate division Zixibacteria bacterium]